MASSCQVYWSAGDGDERLVYLIILWMFSALMFLQSFHQICMCRPYYYLGEGGGSYEDQTLATRAHDRDSPYVIKFENLNCLNHRDLNCYWPIPEHKIGVLSYRLISDYKTRSIILKTQTHNFYHFPLLFLSKGCITYNGAFSQWKPFITFWAPILLWACHTITIRQFCHDFSANHVTQK